MGILGDLKCKCIKVSEKKLVGTLEDPNYKYKKVSGTKTAEQKQQNKNQQNKNCWVTLRHWIMGVPSASAIRSAEQNCGTKTVNKIGRDSAKRS